MNEAYSQENLEKIKRLTEKYEAVGRLELEVAPLGVNFSVRGQEAMGDPSAIRDLEAAADDVLASLEYARRPENQLGELLKRAL